MTDVAHRVLIPVEVLRGEGIPEAVVDAVASVPVVLLGYHEIPEQTAPDQARMQFEETARDELAELVSAFENAGSDVTTRLVFTPDPLKTFERTAVELECDSVLLLNPAPVLEDVLVPLRGDVNVEHIARLVGTIFGDEDVDVTLMHVSPDTESDETANDLLTTAADELVSAGVHPDRMVRASIVDDSPLDVILEAAADHDFVVVGESEPSIRDLLFGDAAETIAEQTVNPVLVVRLPYLEREDVAEQADGDLAEQAAEDASGKADTR